MVRYLGSVFFILLRDSFIETHNPGEYSQYFGVGRDLGSKLFLQRPSEDKITQFREFSIQIDVWTFRHML